MRHLFWLFSLLLSLALPAAAQERPSTILVLDASGSMWGQIDGINKIVIARDVVADLLADFPADQDLGLVAYGHNRRGDCTDIETLVSPAAGSAGAIADIVNALNPRGMTPMTDAVVAAAESLRFTENAATVILVSDGIETCNPDPCAAARVLEETGVDFTAHVVGFDVAGEAEALAQMQCIADETGGLFLTADNAEELSEAMTTVITEAAAAPEPEPAPAPAAVPVRTTITAVMGPDGPLATDQIAWTIGMTDGTAIADGIDDNPLVLELAPGDYSVTATNTYEGSSATATFAVLADAPTDVTVALPVILPTATLDAPASAPVGSTLTVGWRFDGTPDMDFDNVQIVDAAEQVVTYTYVRDGNPVTLVMPGTVGDYELRYKWRDTTVIASQPLAATPAELALIAPDTAVAGSTIAVEWIGPNQMNDNIQIGQPDGTMIDYVYVRDGNPVSLIMPWEPGTYELRYRLRDMETIITRPITITPGEVTLTAPATAPAGSEITVGWTGPDAVNDNVQVGSVGGADYQSYAYTRDGATLTLTVPGEPGAYELRYQFRDRETIHRIPITVTEVAVTLKAADSVTQSGALAVSWTGPGGDSDYIAIGPVGGEDYVTYEYVNRGNPVDVPAPADPGSYELRYHQGSTGAVLARMPLAVTAASASLQAAGDLRPGGTVDVTWTGPANQTDYVSVSRVGEPGYVTYEYVNRGNPVSIALPTEAGSYELRYVLGRGDVVIATLPLTLDVK